MNTKPNLKIKLFADGADIAEIRALYQNPAVSGFTTNPTLMRKAGIRDYVSFARQILELVPDRPVSFEVFADELDEMEAQARTIAGWGRQVNVKIPITNTRGEFTGPIISRLSNDGIVLNITAIMTVEQVEAVAVALNPQTESIISVFAGRIADTGIDPIPHMKSCRLKLDCQPRSQLLWASPRELLNVFHAEEAGCDIITASSDILGKLALVGKNLSVYSLETVQMFRRDAVASQFLIQA